VAVTPNPETLRRLCLSWGVFPLLTPHLKNTDHMLQLVEEQAVKAGMLHSGERVIITAGTPIGARGTTNLIKADIVP
jgi:pyruvate kinase